jgi:hypothetical protein
MLAPLILSSLVGLSSIPPVRLAACEVSTPTTILSDSAPTTVGGYSVRVHFSDSTSDPVSRVTFTLDDGTKVIDIGTFSPGVIVDHVFRLAGSDATTCAVTSVTFADGDIWNAN